MSRQALQDGYSTSGRLGVGLPGVKRLMDEFEISSTVGGGTVVVAKKWKAVTGPPPALQEQFTKALEAHLTQGGKRRSSPPTSSGARS